MIDTGMAAFAYTFISAISSRLGSPTREMIELPRWVEHRDMVLE